MTDQVQMSQWPSDHRYVIPVAPGPDEVTITIDGVEVQVPRGELLIKAAQQHGTRSQCHVAGFRLRFQLEQVPRHARSDLGRCGAFHALICDTGMAAGE